MAIVRMKHLGIIAATSLRDALIRDISKLGCVELVDALSPDWLSLTHSLDTDESEIRASLSEIKTAITEISKHAKVKRGMFSPRIQITEREFFDLNLIADAKNEALQVNQTARELAAKCDSRESSKTPLETGTNATYCTDLINKLAEKESILPKLLAASDALETKLLGEKALVHIRATEKTIILEGWLPARDEKKLTDLLQNYDCAYEIRDPDENEEPPVLTYNTRPVAPFGAITDMYRTPSYHEIDPNPFVFIFFSIFFGIMLSDAAYGIIMAVFGAFMLIKVKPTGTLRKFIALTLICGISAIIWGVLFGGFFGDAAAKIYTMFTGKELPFQTALWFDPIKDPIKLLIFSLILGGIQIFCGMAIKAYLMIRDGQFWGAIFDVGFMWVLLSGVVVAIIGNRQIGLYLLGAGALGIILTHGRHNKGFFSKIFGGLGALYETTKFFGDILSYARLLALSLAAIVIAQVVNTMGTLTGPIWFFIVFIIGHIFNMAVSLIATFVHSARLQYVEFFGKFYHGGGQPFKPLQINTKNVVLIKEEK